MKSKNSELPITEVYEENFIEEIKKISFLLDKYNYIGMDTEFPGIVFPCENYSEGFYYKYIKSNVDKLKLIQLGITLYNSKGEIPEKKSTWQFNLNFNYEKDIHSNESITLLSNCGIDFIKLKNKGINYSTFSEYFISSGLILNEDINWISFNGLSDFCYLLRLALNQNLPENENDFLNELNIYFPNFYDIKILINNKINLKGSLNKISQILNVERIGNIHQAGSDSIITGNVFFKLKNNNIIPKEDFINKKNIVFGVGEGNDENETFQYTQFGNNGHFKYNNYNFGNFDDYDYEQNYYNNNNIGNMQFNVNDFNQRNNFGFNYGNLINNTNNINNNRNYNFEQGQNNNYPFNVLMAYGN